MRNFIKNCVNIFFILSAALIFAQEVDDVDTLTSKIMDNNLKLNTLEREESSILQGIEDKVKAYQESELNREYEEIDSMKADLEKTGEYEEERASAEREVALRAGNERTRLQQDENTINELKKIREEKTNLGTELETQRTNLLTTTYKFKTEWIGDNEYDSQTDQIKMNVLIPELSNDSFEVLYPLKSSADISARERIKKGREEAEKNYNADVYYMVREGNDENLYVVRIISIDVYSADGTKVVSDFKINKNGMQFYAGRLFSKTGTAVASAAKTTTSTAQSKPTPSQTTSTASTTSTATSSSGSSTQNKPSSSSSTSSNGSYSNSDSSSSYSNSTSSRENDDYDYDYYYSDSSSYSSNSSSSKKSSSSSSSSSDESNFYSFGIYLCGGVKMLGLFDDVAWSLSPKIMWADFYANDDNAWIKWSLGSSFTVGGIIGVGKTIMQIEGLCAYMGLKLGSSGNYYYYGGGIGVDIDQGFLLCFHPALLKISLTDFMHWFGYYDIDLSFGKDVKVYTSIGGGVSFNF